MFNKEKLTSVERLCLRPINFRDNVLLKVVLFCITLLFGLFGDIQVLTCLSRAYNGLCCRNNTSDFQTTAGS